MKKLIITHPKHGHLELTEKKDIKKEFNKIMKEGYSGNVPAIFHAEKTNGDIEVYKGKEAKNLLKDPDVKEVTVIAPLAGG
jgi:hypothetical protein